MIALALAQAALAAGVREVPLGSNRGPDVDGYLAPCVRNGRLLWPRGLPAEGAAWCAAFVSWCVWSAKAGDRGIYVAEDFDRDDPHREAYGWPVIGYRASVAELVDDARTTGAWRDVVAGEAPSVGDLLCFGRDGQDPRTGGEGHAGFDAGDGLLLSGNIHNRVSLDALPIPGLVWVGWIRLG